MSDNTQDTNTGADNDNSALLKSLVIGAMSPKQQRDNFTASLGGLSWPTGKRDEECMCDELAEAAVELAQRHRLSAGARINNVPVYAKIVERLSRCPHHEYVDTEEEKVARAVDLLLACSTERQWDMAEANDRVCADGEQSAESDVTGADYLFEALTADGKDLVCIGDQWWLYEDGYYHEEPRAQYGPVALATMTPERQAARYGQRVLDTLQMTKQVPRHFLRGPMAFAPDGAVLINCRNGVLRAPMEGDPELLEHSPEHRFTGRLAAAYDPKATCPLFNKIEQEALPDEHDQDLFEAACAYTLYPSSAPALALFAYGDTGTSKSALFDALVAVLGDGLVERASMADLCCPTGYAIPSVVRAALNLCAEAQMEELSESARWKILVEGGALKVREIYGSPYTVQGYHTKFYSLGNHLPKFRSGTSAELRRCRFLHFQTQHATTDVGLPAKLKAEIDGIFSSLMVPWLRRYIMAEKTLPEGGAASRKLTDDFARENDPYKAFIIACLNVGADLTADKEQVYRAWRNWALDNNVSPARAYRDMAFRRLHALVPGLTQHRAWRGGAGARPRLLAGIAIKAGVDCSNRGGLLPEDL